MLFDVCDKVVYDLCGNWPSIVSAHDSASPRNKTVYVVHNMLDKKALIIQNKILPFNRAYCETY